MFEGENSTIAGDFGSTVSRNFSSDRSSMRAPFSAMLPETRGVSILMRGEAAIAASRLTTGAAAPGWPAGVVADGAEPGCGVVDPGVVDPGAVCGDGLLSSAWVWVCARCRSICGTL